MAKVIKKAAVKNAAKKNAVKKADGKNDGADEEYARNGKDVKTIIEL